MSYVAYNAVGDQVYCKIRGSSERQIRVTGPILESGTKGGTNFDYWCNSSITSVGFRRFDIEYTDGTKIVFGKAELDALMYNYLVGVR